MSPNLSTHHVNQASDASEPRLSGRTLHLTPVEVWAAQQSSPVYTPESFAAEGFVHCTDGEASVLDAGNRYYRNDSRPYVLLDVDLAQVAAPARYEDCARCFPHIYGPIERQAIVRVRRVNRAADGTFLTIDEEQPSADDAASDQSARQPD